MPNPYDIDRLEQQAADHKCALIPAGIEHTTLPTVHLGPTSTGTDLDEFLDLAYHCEVRALYLVDGHAHLGAAATGEPGPTSLQVQYLHAGVLHIWQAS